MTAGFEHRASRFDMLRLDPAGRRLALLVAKRAAELAWLRCATSASCSTVSGSRRWRFAYDSAFWIRSEFGSRSSITEYCVALAPGLAAQSLTAT
uniref:Uncharacterized protein n=1 Tax=Paraburkholderia sprentiae WSM5005 TaxID=754502 RepID=A0A1I9YIM1_9BURK